MNDQFSSGTSQLVLHSRLTCLAFNFRLPTETVTKIFLSLCLTFLAFRFSVDLKKSSVVAKDFRLDWALLLEYFQRIELFSTSKLQPSYLFQQNF